MQVFLIRVAINEEKEILIKQKISDLKIFPVLLTSLEIVIIKYTSSV